MGNKNAAATEIRGRTKELARKIVEQQYQIQPAEWHKYGAQGMDYSLRDMNWTLSFFTQSLEMEDPSLFLDYVSWLKGLFYGLGFGQEALPKMLETTSLVLERELSGQAWEQAVALLNQAAGKLPDVPAMPPSFLETNGELKDLTIRYMELLLQGDRAEAQRQVVSALDRGAKIKDVYLEVFQNTQLEIGRLWQLNKISVAQEHYCTSATQVIMAQLYPRIFSGPRNGLKMIGCSVGGELHEMGIRMVSDFFEMDGWDTYYLGASTPEAGLLKALKDKKPDVLCLSATISFNLPAMVGLIDRIRSDKETKGIKILVGGYPFNVSSGLWRKVGADGFAVNAQQAVEIGIRLIGK